jgi:hypothetical protein
MSTDIRRFPNDVRAFLHSFYTISTVLGLPSPHANGELWWREHLLTHSPTVCRPSLCGRRGQYGRTDSLKIDPTSKSVTPLAIHNFFQASTLFSTAIPRTVVHAHKLRRRTSRSDLLQRGRVLSGPSTSFTENAQYKHCKISTARATNFQFLLLLRKRGI